MSPPCDSTRHKNHTPKHALHGMDHASQACRLVLKVPLAGLILGHIDDEQLCINLVLLSGKTQS